MTQKKDVRFCPYCCLVEFDMATVGASIHCEVCGIDVPAGELVEAI